MCSLSTKQVNNPPQMNSLISYPSSPRCPSIPNSHNESNHSAPQMQWPQCHSHNSQPQLLEGSYFYPLLTTITGEGMACLYFKNVYQWFGLPRKLISDRDPCFTSHFGQALCQQLGIKQNLSIISHPQTDSLSKCKNAWVKQYLRFLTSHQQDYWAHWLPMAMALHNCAINTTTKVTLIKAILRYTPRLSYHFPAETPNQTVEEQKQMALEKQCIAKKALNYVANSTPIAQYKVDDKVWLEGKNLSLPYQTLQLAPKHHRPFQITKVVSPVAYQLELPPSWMIHSVFHTSLLTSYQETLQHGPSYT